MSALSTPQTGCCDCGQTSAPCNGSGPLAAPHASAAHPATAKIRPEDFFREIRYVNQILTRGCNIACAYCRAETASPATPRMSMETFRRNASLLIENSRYPEVALDFHGGEPLLMGDDWLREAVDYAQSLARKHNKTVRHPMQTNGVLLTERRLDMLHELGMMICTSCDGPPHINDRQRAAGKAVQNAIDMLSRRNVRYGVLLVVSRGNCRDMYEVMEYFRAHGVKRFGVNFIQPQGRGADADIPTAREMFDASLEMLRHILDTDCSVLPSDLGMAAHRMVHGRVQATSKTCWEFECGAGRFHISIDPTGDVYPCDSVPVSLRMGNVFHDFDPAVIASVLDKIHGDDPWYIRCFPCAARRICNFNCATANYCGPQVREIHCEYTRLLYEHLATHPDETCRLYEGAERVNVQLLNECK